MENGKWKMEKGQATCSLFRLLSKTPNSSTRLPSWFTGGGRCFRRTYVISYPPRNGSRDCRAKAGIPRASLWERGGNGCHPCRGVAFPGIEIGGAATLNAPATGFDAFGIPSGRIDRSPPNTPHRHGIDGAIADGIRMGNGKWKMEKRQADLPRHRSRSRAGTPSTTHVQKRATSRENALV